jgi:hypothetical protein
MEMFELQEELQSTTDPHSLNALLKSTNQKFLGLQREFGAEIAKGDENEAIQSATKMRYYQKVDN